MKPSVALEIVAVILSLLATCLMAGFFFLAFAHEFNLSLWCFGAAVFTYAVAIAIFRDRY